MLGCVRTSKKKGLRLNSRPFPISVVIRFARVVRKTQSRVFHPALSPATIAPPRWRGHCMRIGRRSLAFLLLASATLWGENPNLGTWKVNFAKSKYTADHPAPKSLAGPFKEQPDGLILDAAVEDAKGNPIKIHWAAKFDGKDHPSTGVPHHPHTCTPNTLCADT